MNRLQANNIQMILLDLGLPDSDSHVDSVERIHGLVPEIPIVVLSGNSYESTGPDVLQRGALYYFPKDLNEADTLGRVIQITLEKHRHQANLRKVIEQSLDGMIIVDEDSRILFANPAGRELLDLVPGGRQTFDYEAIRGERVEETLPSGKSVEIQTVDLEWNSQPACLVTLHDITERKRLERQLHQSQKMEAIGMLAGGVAHDFNNLLTVIRGYAEMLLETTPETDAMRGDLVEISKAAERGSNVTRQLLAFSRQEVVEPRTLNINETVDGVQNLLKRLIGDNIQLKFLPTPDLADIFADPGQLEQVIVNLAINARDAMPRGGGLTIETSMVNVDEEAAQSHLSVVEPGRYVMLVVSDDGVGMDKDVLNHIFEPFFTTKDVGQGTGLGLSTVYGIVEQMNGSIWAYIETGMGTT
ncbi:MAG: PAS domain-containing protein, partial [Pseudomonadales bacterium]|nr:PAS domain-containing protein [Pseudomonadales bacterium]